MKYEDIKVGQIYIIYNNSKTEKHLIKVIDKFIDEVDNKCKIRIEILNSTMTGYDKELIFDLKEFNRRLIRKV